MSLREIVGKKEKETKLASMERTLSVFPFLDEDSFCPLVSRNSSVRFKPVLLKRSWPLRDGGFVMGQIEINCQLGTKLPMWKLRLAESIPSNRILLITEAIMPDHIFMLQSQWEELIYWKQWISIFLIDV